MGVVGVGAMLGTATDEVARSTAGGRAEERPADAAAEKCRSGSARYRTDGDSLVAGVALVTAALRVAPTVVVMPRVGGGRGQGRGGDGGGDEKAHHIVLVGGKVVTLQASTCGEVP